MARTPTQKRVAADALPGSRDLRAAWITGAFRDALYAACPGLECEPVEVGTSVAFMAWDAFCGRYKHRAQPEFMAVRSSALRHRFGRDGFERLNGRYGIFEVLDDWSMREKRARGYKLTDRVQITIETFLRDWLFSGRSLTHLIDRKGRRMRTIPRPIASRNKRGQKVKAWRGAVVRGVVSVDVRSLTRLLHSLDRYLAAEYADGPQPDITPDKARRQRREILQLLMGARTDLAGPGDVIQCYSECSSGRLFAQGLQSVSRAVRKAALTEHYDHDFESCHMNLLEQIGRRLGIKAGEHLKRYNRAVKRTRRQIAQESDLPLRGDEVKKALLAVMCGASRSIHPTHALAKALAPGPSSSDRTIGSLRAVRFCRSPTLMRLYHDIRDMRTRILCDWPNRRGGAITNDAGRAIPERGRNAGKLIAHLLQGAEVVMLRVIADELGEQIEVLQHDGWTTAEPLDTKHLQRLVQERTGYRMRITTKRLASTDAGDISVALADKMTGIEISHPIKHLDTFSGPSCQIVVPLPSVPSRPAVAEACPSLTPATAPAGTAAPPTPERNPS